MSESFIESIRQSGGSGDTFDLYAVSAFTIPPKYGSMDYASGTNVLEDNSILNNNPFKFIHLCLPSGVRYSSSDCYTPLSGTLSPSNNQNNPIIYYLIGLGSNAHTIYIYLYLDSYGILYLKVINAVSSGSQNGTVGAGYVIVQR